MPIVLAKHENEIMKRQYISEAKKAGGNVRVGGWIHEVRNMGKLKFLLLRDRTGILQIIIKKGKVPDELVEMEFGREDVIYASGTITPNKIAPDGVEMVPESIELVGKVSRQLPVDTTELVKSELDTRLDHRYVDLRRKSIGAIFAIKSTLAQGFREAVSAEQFVEIHPTCITGTATEGGTDVFPLQYFENRAYLVQSPQLYKQLCVIGGIDRVYMTVPVFRAEKHNTTTHLNEIMQMDVEMGFADHNDAMDVLERTVQHMLKQVNEKNKGELEVLGVELEVPKKIKRHSYTELVDKLKSEKFDMDWGQDFSKDAEKALQDVLGEEAYFVYDWPTAIRAFYSMPTKENDEICHAFDLIYRGLEVSSGAQRIHVPEMLEEQLKKRGLDAYSFEFYLNAFRLGAPPHAGWSIGLERMAMKVCNLSNIREAMLFPRDRMRLHP